MSDAYQAVVAGHICLDVIPGLQGSAGQPFSQVFLPGRLVEVAAATLATGGAVSNTGLALHKLGVATRLVGKIGRDLFGQAVRQIVDGYGPGLAAGMAEDPAVPTSYSLIISPPGVDRLFLHCPGANDTFTSGDIDYDLLAAARLFHFGYPPIMKRMYEDRGAELVDIFRRAGATGVTTSLDMAFPDPAAAAGRADWRAILAATLPHVHIFMPSVEEILFMMRRDTYDALAADGRDVLCGVTPDLLTSIGSELLSLGVRIVGLKLGGRGFYLRTAGAAALQTMGRGGPAVPDAWANRELWVPCFDVQVAGTTGAGDATIAGFLAGLLNGLSAEEAGLAAVAVGACNVEAPDSLGGLRSWEETQARVAAGWSQRALQIDAPGWRRDPTGRVWRGPLDRVSSTM